MSERRETLLRLLQDETGKITDVKIFQKATPGTEAPEEPETPEDPGTPGTFLTVIELKPDTKETFLRDLTEGSVVDWGDGTKSVVTADEAQAKEVKHTYAATATANRVVTIDGEIDRTGELTGSAFDPKALTVVRSLGELIGEAKYLFLRCTSLTAIPANLFANCTEVTDFDGCFFHCSSLTTIPAGLFDNCTSATNYIDCFNTCSSLTTIPQGLFDNCTEATNFRSCFVLCSSLTGETPYTMVGGKKVKLWERSPENGFTKVTDHRSCFARCTELSDYAEIPGDWK